MLSAVLMPQSIALAKRLGAADNPNDVKIHKDVTLRGGGVAFVVAWLAIMGGLYLASEIANASARVVMGIVIGASLLAAVGFLDDMRSLSSVFKLIFQIGAAVAFVLIAGPSINLKFYFYGPVVFWIVLATNAFNLIDGLDGLAAGLAIISATGFAAYAFITSSDLLLVLSLALVGVCLPFIRYNWYPAKIFMGDVGSYFLGFLIAVFALILVVEDPSGSGVPIALSLTAVPLFDTALTIFRRFTHKKPLFKPDKSHFYNLLMNRGFSHINAVLFCYGLAAVFISLGMSFLVFPNQLILWTASIATVVGLVGITIKFRLLTLD